MLTGLLLAVNFLSMGASAATGAADQDRLMAQYQNPENAPERRGSFHTSLLPGEETLDRFVPKTPLKVDEVKKLEARKLYVLGHMQLNRKQLHKAIETFKEALEHDPTSLPVLRELVALCFQLERGREAMEYCERALKLDPENFVLLHLYGIRSAEQGNLPAAISALERAAKAPGIRETQGQMLLEIQSDLAELYERQKDYKGMARTLRDVIEIAEHPQDYNLDEFTRRQFERKKTRFYENLGRALKELKQYDEAVKVLTQAQEADARGNRLAFILAEIYAAQGNDEKALAELDKALDAEVQDERVYQLYEKTLTKLGRQSALLPRLEKAVEKDKHNPTLKRFYGEKLADDKQYAKAEQQLLEIENRPETLPILARVYREMNEPAKLLETLAKSLEPSNGNGQQAATMQLEALSKDPAFIKKMAEAGRKGFPDKNVDLYSKFVIALAARAAKDVELSKEFYQLCIEQRPELAELPKDLLTMLLENERYADVVEVATKARERHPNDFRFYEYHAQGLELLGKTDEAVAVLQELIDRTPDRETLMNANLALAWIYQHAEKYDKAIEVCERLIEEFAGSTGVAVARYRLSNILTVKGDLKKAEDQLLKLVESEPQEVPPRVQAAANNDLGYIWADEGKNLERAESMIKKALDVQPDSAAYLDSMGWVLFKRGKYAEAVKYLKDAVAKEDGTDAVLWDHLGDAHLQNGDSAAAAKAWEKCVELYKKESPDKKSKDEEKRKQVEKKLQLLKTKSSSPVEKAGRDAP